MYPEYKLIQIVEVPKNGNNKYAIREIAHMDYFEFDFKSKNSIKKFLAANGYESGEYLIITENERNGDQYLILAVCSFRAKEFGNFVDFKIPGDEWKNIVREVMEQLPIIDMRLDIQTTNKVSIPKILEE